MEKRSEGVGGLGGGEQVDFDFDLPFKSMSLEDNSNRISVPSTITLDKKVGGE